MELSKKQLWQALVMPLNLSRGCRNCIHNDRRKDGEECEQRTGARERCDNVSGFGDDTAWEWNSKQ